MPIEQNLIHASEPGADAEIFVRYVDRFGVVMILQCVPTGRTVFGTSTGSSMRRPSAQWRMEVYMPPEGEPVIGGLGVARREWLDLAGIKGISPDRDELLYES